MPPVGPIKRRELIFWLRNWVSAVRTRAVAMSSCCGILCPSPFLILT